MLDRVVNTLLSKKLPEPMRHGERLELHIQEESLTLHKPYASEIRVRPKRLVLRADTWRSRDGTCRLYWVFDSIIS